MGWNDHIDQELTDSMKELISGGFVFEGGLPFDVAKKVLATGKESLSAVEAQVFERELMPALQALEEAKAEKHYRDVENDPTS